MPRRARHTILRANLAGHPLRLAHAAQKPRLHGDGDTYAGARHWREHRNFFHDEYGAAAKLAGAQSGRTGGDFFNGAEIREPTTSFSYPMYRDIRDKNDVFDGVLAVGGAPMNMSYAGESERVRARLVSGNYFDVLGVRARIGRLFTQDDDRIPGAHPVVVLSYGFWESHFGKDPSIIGKTILAE